ncbi:MAG: SUMF1/EgtB/PvdO family nonheme iron enzyme, partial [Candidatus Hydrogenedentes bacterium]|nr:SUMF1/EgtB/PvdO family nonheme iron enzyme [Candidatus Hydrogenedentota bacterium]
MNRRSALVFAAAFVGCFLGWVPAWAEGPAVSNLTFTQGPNGTGGTQVDIYYDLDSPNGNCTVTAKLSKDNGASFPFDITTAAGDIGSNVVPGSGKHIVWDVAADYPDETIAQAKIRIIAYDGVPSPVVTSLEVNSGAATTSNVTVTLNNTATNSPTDYMASESSEFSGASWQAYSASPSFTLSPALGVKTVYFKVRNGLGESPVVTDTIFLEPEMVSVAAGTFIMGRTAGGDDATYGSMTEDPPHDVTLAAYRIGKFNITNKQYCDVLNWALAQGYLEDSAGGSWAGTEDIYAGGNRQIIVSITPGDCNIQYAGGVFSSKTRTGLPGTTTYSMDTHPMVKVSWYGAAAFCNWLSEMQALTPCYDMSAANWPLTAPPPTAGGYRLPTEAEWERAAAWDGARHWIYGFTSDVLVGRDRCNYDDSTSYVNPLGLTSLPYTSPVGWFNGTNVSPNGNISTENSASPAGCYDMSGQVYEWVNDWYAAYSSEPQTNPTGPAIGAGGRVFRGGAWDD